MRRIVIVLLCLSIAAVLQSVPQAEAVDRDIVSIGGGGVAGVYYPASAAICRLVNKTRKEHGILCVAESTVGSVSNLNALADGDLDLVIAQSDWQYHAYRGTSKFAEQGANSDLRAIFSLHSEPFTLVARTDSGIQGIADLKGKRVNIGNPGSGQRGTMDVVMAALGWDYSDFSQVSELASAEQSKALCENQFDAMVFTVGHPSSSIREATSSCDVRLVNVAGPLIDKLVTDHDYYLAATIPGGLYRGTVNDIATFGVGATLVASAKLADEIVYQLVKVVFENFNELRSQHPVFSSLNKQEMVTSGLSAPLHRGALRYYQEVGLR